jgi:hypothetical protein
MRRYAGPTGLSAVLLGLLVSRGVGSPNKHCSLRCKSGTSAIWARQMNLVAWLSVTNARARQNLHAAVGCSQSRLEQRRFCCERKLGEEREMGSKGLYAMDNHYPPGATYSFPLTSF